MTVGLGPTRAVSNASAAPGVNGVPKQVGPFVFRVGNYWNGQTDAALVEGLKARLAQNLPADAREQAFELLELPKLATRRLTPIERELFAFLDSPEGRKVDLFYENTVDADGNSGAWVAEGGRYRVDFGLDITPTDPRPGPRTRYQLMLHELSHAMDGITDLELRKSGKPNPVKNYASNRPMRWRPPHQVLYEEMRANLFATGGNLKQAWNITSVEYSIGFIQPEGVDLYKLSPDQIYRLAENMTRRFGGESVGVTPELLKQLLRK
jgi:hypothetical protein